MMTENLNRLRWACRRGMLELDVILRPFVDNHYLSLTPEEQVTFKQLLAGDDPELYAWFMGHEACNHEPFKQLIAKILLLNEQHATQS